MKNKDYTQALTDKDKLHVRFTEDHGEILEFIVEYFSLVDSRWRTIMRIDNCHDKNWPHKHTYYLKKKKIKIYWDGDPGEVFTQAKRHIVEKFPDIKENFLMNN
jgi:hypothetical protein